MTIWQYGELHKASRGLLRGDCPFCKTHPETIHDQEQHEESQQSGYVWNRRRSEKVAVCGLCGWWRASLEEGNFPSHTQLLMKGFQNTYGAIGTLRNLDLDDLSLPMDEVRSYLLARYDARFDINPRLFEETVASVFRDFGYSAEVTAYRGDGGIDVILRKSDREVGVQVKRHQASIKVEQLRSLVGALVLSGKTEGIFVTTSTFQSGAVDAVTKYRRRGYVVELVDAARFLDALRIVQRPGYRNFEDFTEMFKINFDDLPNVSHVSAC